jgi:putative transposase
LGAALLRCLPAGRWRAGKGADFDVGGLMFVTRNPLQRYYDQGDLHFVTFSCYQRRPFLGTARARDLFAALLNEVRGKYGFLLLGYVVMPEHVHLLISEPKTGDPSKILQALKQRVSIAFSTRRRKPLSASRDSALSADAPVFWQRRFYDFNVWSDAKVKEKLHYMHRNPVQRGLVKHPRDWPWSSWLQYETGVVGLIPIDGLGRREDPD